LLRTVYGFVQSAVAPVVFVGCCVLSRFSLSRLACDICVARRSSLISCVFAYSYLSRLLLLHVACDLYDGRASSLVFLCFGNILLVTACFDFLVHRIGLGHRRAFLLSVVSTRQPSFALVLHATVVLLHHRHFFARTLFSISASLESISPSSCMPLPSFACASLSFLRSHLAVVAFVCFVLLRLSLVWPF
jgi:hypothetical protein